MPQVIQREKIIEVMAESPAETAETGRNFARRLKTGDVVAFRGDLGSGKTLMIKAICAELNCAETVSSPSFTILNIYQAAAGYPVYHFDFYRIESKAELVNLGLEEYLYDEGICLIEWAEKVTSLLPLSRYEVNLRQPSGNPMARSIEIYRVFPNNQK